MKSIPVKSTTTLTPEERAHELRICDDRMSCLDGILNSLSPLEKAVAMANLLTTTKQAIVYVYRKLYKWKLLPCSELGHLPIKVCFVPSEFLRLHLSSDEIPPAAIALAERREIQIPEHFALAPKEVARSVIVHECLHIVYPQVTGINPDCLIIRDDILEKYPEDQHQEEEWVRRMEARINGRYNLLEAWDISIAISKSDWRRTYYNVKKLKNLRP